MNRHKKHFFSLTALLLTVLLAVFCVAAPTLITDPPLAAAADNSAVKNTGTGEISAKEEVVYARLANDGTVKNIYTVNILNVSKEGVISDYGSFSNLKNLSSLAAMNYQGDTLTVDAKPGRFYYQGDLTSKELPWKVSLDYGLDGSNVKSSELSGKSGLLELRIKSSANDKVNSDFYDHYLLQITVTLDTAKCTDITAEGATFANSGSNKLLTFSILPKKDADLLITAKVKDFTMEGVQISAVPFAMNIELPDTSSMTDDLMKLTDAIAQLGDGVGDLEDGIKTLSSGTDGLRSGSARFASGISTLDTSSAQLVSGSKSISDALTTLSASLQNSLQSNDMTALTQLPPAMTQLSDGLKSISGGMKKLSEGYGSTYTALDTAIKSIPVEDIPQEDLQSLAVKNPFNKTLDQLLEYYKAAQTIKYTYVQVSPAFSAVSDNLSKMAGSVDTIASSLDTVALQLTSSMTEQDLTTSITKLVTGINTLSSNYKEFHNGLKKYTAGVSTLSANYAKLNQGINDLAGGTGKIADGAGKLNNGAEELVQQTKDMPSQMDETIDSMLSDYDTSDFTPISFVSPKNEHVSTVQFVLKTAAIEPLKEPEPAAAPKQKETFWTRFLNLFR